MSEKLQEEHIEEAIPKEKSAEAFAVSLAELVEKCLSQLISEMRESIDTEDLKKYREIEGGTKFNFSVRDDRVNILIPIEVKNEKFRELITDEEWAVFSHNMFEEVLLTEGNAGFFDEVRIADFDRQRAHDENIFIVSLALYGSQKFLRETGIIQEQGS